MLYFIICLSLLLPELRVMVVCWSFSKLSNDKNMVAPLATCHLKYILFTLLSNCWFFILVILNMNNHHLELQGKSGKTQVQLHGSLFHQKTQCGWCRNTTDMKCKWLRAITWCCMISSFCLDKTAKVHKCGLLPIFYMKVTLYVPKNVGTNARQTERMNLKCLPAAVKSCKCLSFFSSFC